MSLTYTIYSSERDGAGATVIFSDRTIQQVSHTNPTFNQLVALLTTTPVDEIDEDEVRLLITPALGVGKTLTRLSERVSFDGANILFDGDVVSDAIGEHILRIVKEGGSTDSYKALVAFMEKLYTNPSEASRNSLYDFILKYGFTIDPDGDFYAYKGLNEDSTSRWSGFGIVDGVAMNDHLPNKPGSVIEMPRTQVEQDPNMGCAVGLHAGTYAYADGYANGVLVLVKINPRDVVSVPSDHSYAKIRVCRYKVVTQTVQQTKATTFTNEVATDLDKVNTVTKMTDAGQKVPVSFTYTRGNGSTIKVEGEVTAVRKASYDRNESIIVIEDENGQNHFYPTPYVSDIVIATAPAPLSVKKSAPHVSVSMGTGSPSVQAGLSGAGAWDVLRAALNMNETVLCDFNYTTVKGEARTVTNFEATELRIVGRGAELLVGEREDGETRSYRAERITDLVINGDVEEADEEEEVLEDSVEEASALPVLAPKGGAVRSTLDELKDMLNEDCHGVFVDFTYTTVQGETRKLEGFMAQEITDTKRGEVLVGQRTDGETRSYRLDRVVDLVIKQIW